MSTLHTTTKRVYPRLVPNAKLAIVGEAPGMVEVARGEPFIGPSGKILSMLLGQRGISKSDVFITNVLKTTIESYGGKDVKKNDAAKFSRNFPREYEEALVELERELTHPDMDIQCVLAMGNLAVEALTGKKGITKHRGSVYFYVRKPDVKVVPCFHVTNTFRERATYFLIAHDIGVWKEESSSKEIHTTPYKAYIRPGFQQVISYLTNILNTPQRITYDIETSREELYCFGIGNTKEAMVIPFMYKNVNFWTLDQELEIMDLIAAILESEEHPKVAQNAIFDGSFMWMKYGIHPKMVDFDTMVAQAIIFPDLPKGLDMLTSLYTDLPYYKDEGKDWNNIRDDEAIWNYNAKDVIATARVMEAQAQLILKYHHEETFTRQMGLIPILTRMSVTGVPLDVKGMRERAAAFEDTESELQTKLNAIVKEKTKGELLELNPNSSQQMQDYFYDRLGIRPYRNKAGVITVDKLALKRLVKTHHLEEAQIIQDIKAKGKQRSTYLNMMVDEDWKFRCSYNPVGTDNGRISSSKNIFGKGTNFQNIPYAVRRYFNSHPDHFLTSIDLGQAENRIVAYVADDKSMTTAFEQGIDIHSRTGAMLATTFYGRKVTTEEVKRWHKEDQKAPIGDGSHTWRDWGKRSNHGLNYGFGYRAFSLMYQIPEPDAKFIVENYHNIYPDVRNSYQAQIIRMIEQDGYVLNLKGRRRYFLKSPVDSVKQEAYRLGFSVLPQSTVADIVAEAMFELEKMAIEGKVIPINQVHDSIGFDTPFSIGLSGYKEVVSRVVKILEQPLRWKSGPIFSIPADIAIGLNLGKRGDDNPLGLKEIKSSEIETAYNEVKHLWQEGLVTG